jgi:hypothetical protein
MRKNFPILFNSNHVDPKSRWSNKPVKNCVLPIVASNTVQHCVGTGQFSGLYLKHFIGDWASYEVLTFEIWASTSGFITFKIYDVEHEFHFATEDRFNKRIQLNNGWNTISINLLDVRNAPLTRAMDMQNIRHLGLFSSAPHTIQQFAIRSVSLSPRRISP